MAAQRLRSEAVAPNRVNVLGADGTTKGSVELPDAVFGVQVNVPVMHRVVHAQRAAARAGTHSTKTRGDVRGGGKKPWRQKGTGRARQGSIRSPQWTGGGVVFGPHPRDYSIRVNKKEKVLALRSALTDRRSLDAIHVLDALDFDAPKTRVATRLLDTLELAGRKILLVVDGQEQAAIRSFRNLPHVHLLTFDQLNTYDVLYSDAVVFTRSSLDAFLGRSGLSTAAPADDELVLETEPEAVPEATPSRSSIAAVALEPRSSSEAVALESRSSSEAVALESRSSSEAVALEGEENA